MDRGTWWAIVHGVTKSRTRLSDWTDLTFLLGRKAMTNIDSVLIPTKVQIVKPMAFPVSCMHVKLGHKESWALKNWCFQIVVLEKTLEIPLDSKAIKPVHPKGNQPWIFIGRTDAKAKALIRWPLDVNSRLFGKDSDVGKDWGQEKGRQSMRWHHCFNGQESEQTWI